MARAKPEIPDAIAEITSGDPVEGRLLAAIAADPTDAQARSVYADWLEQRADLRALLLRLEPGHDVPQPHRAALATPDGAGWRAVIARPPIAKCLTFAFECPKRWDTLAPTAERGVRHCHHCDQPVHFVATLAEARTHGAARHCIALDAAVSYGEAMVAYEGPKRHVRMGVVMPEPPELGRLPVPPVPPPSPPPPPPPPAPKSIARRVLGWFKR